MAAPSVQHYKNPLKWGWYFVKRQGDTISGLMSQRAARKMRREMSRGYGAGYGLSISYHPDAPEFKALRRIGFPIQPLSDGEKVNQA